MRWRNSRACMPFWMHSARHGRNLSPPHPTRVAIAPALTLVNQAIDETNAGIRYA